MRLALVFLLALLLAPGAGRWGSSVARATSLRFTVITTADAPDAQPGDGLCADADGQCTLRAVVQGTDAQPAGSSVAVSVPAGTYLLTLGTLTLSRNSVRLLGTGASLTLLTGQGSRVLTVDAEARLALSGVTLTGGTAPAGQPGGALANQGVTVLTNRSVLSNTAPISGGGIRNVGANVALMVRLVAVTVASNSTGLETLAPATTALTDTIIADSASGPNCSGPLAESAGYNLESSTTCGFSQPTDLTNTNPLLGPLQNNGGPTRTMALLPGSPAIDHGGTAATGCPATDQRGLPRPDEAVIMGSATSAPMNRRAPASLSKSWRSEGLGSGALASSCRRAGPAGRRRSRDAGLAGGHDR